MHQKVSRAPQSYVGLLSNDLQYFSVFSQDRTVGVELKFYLLPLIHKRESLN